MKSFSDRGRFRASEKPSLRKVHSLIFSACCNTLILPDEGKFLDKFSKTSGLLIVYHYTVSHRVYSQATGCNPKPRARTHTAPMLRLYPYIRVGTCLQSTGHYGMGTWGHSPPYTQGSGSLGNLTLKIQPK